MSNYYFVLQKLFFFFIRAILRLRRPFGVGWYRKGYFCVFACRFFKLVACNTYLCMYGKDMLLKIPEF